MKKAFTIIELIMVVGILAILMSIVVSSAKGAFISARRNKAIAQANMIKVGLSTYYAVNGKWPGQLGERIANGTLGVQDNGLSVSGQADANQYILSAEETHDMIREMVRETTRGNPCIDASGLSVSSSLGLGGKWDGDTANEYPHFIGPCTCPSCRNSSRNDQNTARDFMDALKGTKQNPKRMKLNDMNFGYPSEQHGKFRHFKIIYSIPANEMKVGRQGDNDL